MIKELELLVRELIDDNVDHVALAKTLVIVDRYLLPPQPMSEQLVEAMLEKLFWYWVKIDDLTDYRNELEALRTMTPAEMAALQWFDQCHDCGDRAWVQLHEDYMVRQDIWHQACVVEPVMKNGEGMLCVGCIEQRLGRQLCRDDFGGDVPCNVDQYRGQGSERLLDRMTRR